MQSWPASIGPAIEKRTLATHDVGIANPSLEVMTVSDAAIRWARPADAQHVARLLTELGCSVEAADVRRRIERLQETTTSRIFLAEADGQVVGLIGMHIGPLLHRAAARCRRGALGSRAGVHAGRTEQRRPSRAGARLLPAHGVPLRRSAVHQGGRAPQRGRVGEGDDRVRRRHRIGGQTHNLLISPRSRSHVVATARTAQGAAACRRARGGRGSRPRCTRGSGNR